MSRKFILSFSTAELALVTIILCLNIYWSSAKLVEMQVLQNIRDKIVGDYNANNAQAFETVLKDYVVRTAKVPKPSIKNITYFQKATSRQVSSRKYLAVVTYPASFTYVIGVNTSTHSLIAVVTALTNQDILLDLQIVLRGITSVSIPTFVDLSAMSGISKPSARPTYISSVSSSSSGTGYLHVAQVISLDAFPSSASDLDAFKSKFSRAVALVLSIDDIFVIVTLFEQRVLLRSSHSPVSLLSVSVGVEYTIESPDGSSICGLIIKLNQAISDGTLGAKLDSLGLYNVLLGAVTTTDICQITASGSSISSSAVQRLGSTRIAIIVAVIILVCILLCLAIVFFCCRRERSRSKVYVADPVQHDFSIQPCPLHNMVPYKVPLVGPRIIV